MRPSPSDQGYLVSVRPQPLARRDIRAWLELALARLDDWGLLLESDPKLPTWPALVTERPVRGSWWADPEVQLIHEAGSRFLDHPDVLRVVLVSGKLTCVHRRLWPALLAVALPADGWKFDGLSGPARTIWERLQRESPLHADEPDLPSTSVRENGRLMRELQARLLCAGGDVHTARGSHAKFVTTWESLMIDRKLFRPELSASAGMQQLEDCVARLNHEFGAHGTVPWARGAAENPRREIRRSRWSRFG
jgi:hypothetical protein